MCDSQSIAVDRSAATSRRAEFASPESVRTGRSQTPVEPLKRLADLQPNDSQQQESARKSPFEPPFGVAT